MVSILLNWIYIFLTTFAMGFAFSKFVQNRLNYQIRGIDAVVSCGMIIATVYAQLFSLVYKVGLLANLLMVLLCLVIYIVWWKEIAEQVGNMFRRSSNIKSVLIVLLIIIWSYCTSRGYMHYDSDLYHAQSIRWIEEYGVVKGLGNIHVRFAYNSSFFAVSALYSMKFLIGQSLHTVNGFIALILSLEVLKLTDIVRRKSVLLSDFARLGAFYYLTVIYRDIIAPASDYAIMCIVFFLIIKWLAQLEQDRETIVPFALLCVGGVFAVSVKLTAGLILLLVIKPAYRLIKEKNWRDIVLYILMGLVILLPWMARTIVISGYLLYPFPALDVFSVDWKIPAEAAALDAAEIKTWGRGLNDATLVDLGISEWFPGWFRTMLPATGKLLVALDMLCIVLFAVILIRMLVSKRKRTVENMDCLLVLGSVIVSYIFWQTSAPLLRYGYAYVLLVVMLTAGVLWGMWCSCEKKLFYRAFAAGLVLFTLIKFVSLAGYMYGVADKPYYWQQGDYGTYALESYEVNEVLFYYPESGDRVGYSSFPALPRKTEIRFRGSGLKDGFLSDF